MTEPLRLLLLTSNTGYAHNAAANAVKEWGEFLYKDEVNIEIEYILENSNPTYHKLVNLYNFIQRNIPWLHNLYWLILEFQEPILQNANPSGIFVGKQYWHDRLQSYRPHVIISTHCQTNLGYFDVAQQVLGESLKCVTYCTEIDGDWGFTHNWINPAVDIFWSQTPECSKQAINMNLNPEQIFTWGTLLNRSFYQPIPTDLEKSNFLESELGLEANRFTILLATGGAGANNHLRFLDYLLDFDDQVQVIALCGKNVKTKEKLEAWRQKHPHFLLKPLAFTDQMAMLLRISSVVVARPGARTAIESLHCHCPMIFNLLGGIMPQERLALRYFKKRDIYNAVSNPSQIVPIIQNWLDHPDTYRDMKQKLSEVYQPSSPIGIMDVLMKTLRSDSQSSQSKLQPT